MKSNQDWGILVVDRKLIVVCRIVFVLAVTGLVSVGCTSVPVTDSGKRGAFQGKPQWVVRHSVGSSDSVQAGKALPSVGTSIDVDAKQLSDSGFVWPLKSGKITSVFGNRKRAYHEGVDIRAPHGTPVFAARAGRVIYSSKRIRGYGNMIVIKHDEGWATVYAHNRKNLVRRGDRVTQGQMIGAVGATGKATGPHLHFEIRKGEVPQDPLLYLPALRSPAIARN